MVSKTSKFISHVILTEYACAPAGRVLNFSLLISLLAR